MGLRRELLQRSKISLHERKRERKKNWKPEVLAERLSKNHPNNDSSNRSRTCTTKTLLCAKAARRLCQIGQIGLSTGRLGRSSHRPQEGWKTGSTWIRPGFFFLVVFLCVRLVFTVSLSLTLLVCPFLSFRVQWQPVWPLTHFALLLFLLLFMLLFRVAALSRCPRCCRKRRPTRLWLLLSQQKWCKKLVPSLLSCFFSILPERAEPSFFSVKRSDSTGKEIIGLPFILNRLN